MRIQVSFAASGPGGKSRSLITILAAALTLAAVAGCSKPEAPTPSAPAASNAGTSPMQPVLQSWEQGDQPTAVQRFLEVDWNARPLFPPGSTLNLSESQFVALPPAERSAKASEVTQKAEALKKLAVAVADAGRAAAARNDSNEARRHFTALQQFGDALASPDSLAIIQLVGKSIKKMAAAELAK